MINSNPAEKVILPNKKKFVGKFYDKDELADLFEASKDTTLETVILLTAYYGLRRSEVIGLRWQDVDFKNKTVSIRHKVVQISEGKGRTELLFEDILKTSSSFRTFPLIPQVGHHLRQAQERQRQGEDFFKSTYNGQYSEYICVWRDGNIITPNYTTRAFKELLESKGLREIRFHDLRHSCATLLLSLGFSIKQIQEWMGHGNYSTTADIYAHVDYKSKIALAEKLEESLLPSFQAQDGDKNPRLLKKRGSGEMTSGFLQAKC
jgi:integrase